MSHPDSSQPRALEDIEMDDLPPSSADELIISAREPTTFFSLPIELRAMIYKLNLSKPWPVILQRPRASRHFSCSHAVYRTPVLGVNLLRSCRQIYLEASQYLYAGRHFRMNTICSTCFENLQLSDTRLLRTLSASTLNKIEKLELPLHIDCTYVDRRDCNRALTNIRLPLASRMESLKELSLKVVLFDSQGRPDDVLSEVCPVELDALLRQVYGSIPPTIKVDWEVEVYNEEGFRCEEEINKAGTEDLRAWGKVYQPLQVITFGEAATS